MAHKQLILLRHAKALERSEFEGRDFDRPLSVTGEHSIQIIARYLRLIGIKPEQILASPSVRTRMTAEAIGRRYGIDENIEYIDDLYNDSRTNSDEANKVHLKSLKKAKSKTKTMMIVGHNDDLTEFAKYLTGDDIPYMKKGSLIVLSIPDSLSWSEIGKDTLDIIYYLTPQFLVYEKLAN